MEFLKKFVSWLMLERPAQHKSPADFAQALETSGTALLLRLQNAAQTPQNHKVFTHIIGIENGRRPAPKSRRGRPSARKNTAAIARLRTLRGTI